MRSLLDEEDGMERKVLVPVADGSEELETVAIVDVLRRAGAKVTMAALEDLAVKGSKGVRLTADRLLSDCASEIFDLIALPGGMPGAERLRDSEVLVSLLRRQAEGGRLYAAVCASPAVALYPHGLLRGKRFTCHPNFAEGIGEAGLSAEAVVVDGNLVTGRGAGTATDFALVLVDLLYGAEKTQEVRRGMAI
jgi:protein deglycase